MGDSLATPSLPAAPLPAGLAIGQEVGAYRIVRLLDTGGMGAVFEVVHRNIGRRAAIKVLRRELARDPEFTTRFLNEARAVNLIGHPGVVEIFEFGHLPDETPYLIMEFLTGESLGKRLARPPHPPLETALHYTKQIAQTLAAAHEKGVVHRDLKPDNVFVITDGEGGERTKVLDFGIAKLRPELSVTGAAVTKVGTTMGSPQYMAPEQCYELGQVTDRADVYALGVMLFELVVGKPPFVSDLPAEVMVMQAKAAAPRLSSLIKDIPTKIDALVERMLRKNPAERPSMTEVAQTIDELLNWNGRSRTLPPLQLEKRATHWLPVGLVSTVILFLLGGIGWMLGVGRTPHPGRLRPPQEVAARALLAAQKEGPPRGDKAGVGREIQAATRATVRYELDTIPAGAQIFDEASGQLLGMTPLRVDLPHNSTAQKLIIRRAGFVDREVSVDRSRDTARTEVLAAAVKRSTGTGPSTKARPYRPASDGLLAPNP